MRRGPTERSRDDRLVTTGAAVAVVTTLLVALAVGAHRPAFVLLLLVGIGTVVWLVWRALPDDPMLAVTLATGIPLYTAAYVVGIERAFPQAHVTAVYAGFFLPLIAFVLGVRQRRDEIARRLAGRRGPAPVGRGFVWLAASGVLWIGADLFLPAQGSTPLHTVTLLTVMLGICLLTRLMIVDAALLLDETGHLFRTFVARMAHRSVPVFSFLVVFGFIVLIFGTLYAILDNFSHTPNFSMGSAGARLTFADALYFSIVTLSTIGYGDITPASGIARLMVGAEILFGVVLLLFAFAEIAAYEPPVEPEDEPGEGPAGRPGASPGGPGGDLS